MRTIWKLDLYRKPGKKTIIPLEMVGQLNKCSYFWFLSVRNSLSCLLLKQGPGWAHLYYQAELREGLNHPTNLKCWSLWRNTWNNRDPNATIKKRENPKCKFSSDFIPQDIYTLCKQYLSLAVTLISITFSLWEVVSVSFPNLLDDFRFLAPYLISSDYLRACVISIQ